MRVAFDMLSVKRWAEFSGDYNPIHFDIDYAQSAGLGELVVHGMLALLPIKQALSCHSSVSHDTPNVEVENFASSWFRFRAAFRTPVPHNSVSVLDVRSSGRNINFQLSGGESGDERFRGGFGPVARPLDENISDDLFENCSRIENERRDKFIYLYPEISERWIVLDAVVFSDFICTKLDVVREIVRKSFFDRYNAEMPEAGIVVQTSHVAIVDMAAFKSESASHLFPQNLAYTMKPPVMIVDGGQVTGSISLVVYSDTRPIMLVEIGLLQKIPSH